MPLSSACHFAPCTCGFAGLNAVGGSSGTPFAFKCPTLGSFINKFSGQTWSDSVQALGPIQCSDGSQSTDLWGYADENTEGFSAPTADTFATGCSSLDICTRDFGSGYIFVTKLDFTACGGNVVGAVGTLTTQACPSGMRIVGVHGRSSANLGVQALGLYCGA
jgi:hypothetical protein